MGAWGYDTFDNDTACDWTYDLEQCNDLSLIQATLAQVLENCNDYLDADIAAQGLAACDTLARLRGNFGIRNAYTETVDQWVAAHPELKPEPLLALAHQVIDCILSEGSELKELWEDSESYSQWQTAVENLRSRLT